MDGGTAPIFFTSLIRFEELLFCSKTIEKVVASDTGEPGFESSHWHF